MPKQRLPSIITLPFGYIIKINQTSKRHMLRVLKAEKLLEPPIAFWDDSNEAPGGTIWLLRQRTRLQKIEDIGHEMVHAVNDWAAWLLAKERGE